MAMIYESVEAYVDKWKNAKDSYEVGKLLGQALGLIVSIFVVEAKVAQVLGKTVTALKGTKAIGKFVLMLKNYTGSDRAGYARKIVKMMKAVAESVENSVGHIARYASGARRSALNILTEEEMTLIKNEFTAIGGDPSKLVFNQGGGTCYIDELDQIFVRGDIFPLEDVAHPRSSMSPRAVLAHEYYGHAANAGTPVPPGMWNDEFRASYMAAKNAPNLTDLDRYHLIQDAITRAQEAGVTIELNDFMRSILYGY